MINLIANAVRKFLADESGFLRVIHSGPSGGSATISTATFPADQTVLVGQPLLMRVSDITGLTGVTDRYEEIFYEWDFGDAGSTYATGGAFSSNANVAHGAQVVKAWASSGSKTVTVRAYVHGQGLVGTATISVTVEAASSRSWTHKIYYSPDGNFTGADAETGNVEHVTTLTELNTLIGAGDDVWLLFRRGETYTWGTTAIDLSDDNITLYTDTYQSGAKPRIEADGTANSFSDTRTIFNKGGATGTSVILRDLDVDGFYEPSTGQAPQGSLSVCTFSNQSAGQTQYVSAFQCTFKGVFRVLSGGGAAISPGGNTYGAMVDCAVENWLDYGSTSSSGVGWWGFAGCHFLQDPLAIMRDGKEGVLPQGPDHGPVRMNTARYFSAYECRFASNSGWSVRSSPGRAIQPCLRIYPYGAGALDGNVQRCFGVGPTLITTGFHTPDDGSNIVRPQRLVVDGNFLIVSRQSNGFVTANSSGVYARNNVVYMANICDELGVSNNFFIGLETPSYTSADAGAFTNPIVAEFNTVYSDRSADSGFNDAYSFVNYNTSLGAWPGPTPTTLNNIIEVPNHSNAGTFTDYTPLSPEDYFQHTSASAADDAVSSGTIPYFDFGLNVRGATTSIGAHNGEVASVSNRSAPVNSSPPTIAELTGFSGEIAKTGLGTWSNLDWHEAYLWEDEWRDDGVAVANAKLTYLDTAGLSGNMTNNLTVTNLSGVRVSAESAAVVV